MTVQNMPRQRVRRPRPQAPRRPRPARCCPPSCHCRQVQPAPGTVARTPFQVLGRDGQLVLEVTDEGGAPSLALFNRQGNAVFIVASEWDSGNGYLHTLNAKGDAGVRLEAAVKTGGTVAVEGPDGFTVAQLSAERRAGGELILSADTAERSFNVILAANRPEDGGTLTLGRTAGGDHPEVTLRCTKRGGLETFSHDPR